MKRIVLLFFATAFSVVAGSARQFEAELVSAESYKYQTAKRIFESLVSAKGDKRMQTPEFVMSKNKRYVAWMDDKKLQIGLEELAYDVCISFGADSLNALAALIGHEVTHYYEKHAWGSDFATAFTDLDVAKTVKTNTKSLETKTTNEAAADYLGGFLAYSAGFQTFGIMPRLLVDLYGEYGLPNNIPGYPSLDDRSRMAVESEMKLEELIHVFDAANYMVVLQQHEVVNDYYSFILREFQSREIYNNAGVNALLAALQLFDADDAALKYAYPIQLDGETRMTRPKARGDIYGFAERTEKRNQFLKQAALYFSQAAELDKDYATALINLACVESILGNYEEAEYAAKKAFKLAKQNNDTKSQGDANIVQGIAAIQSGENEDGLDLLGKASKIEAARDLAQLNMDIFNGKKPVVATTKPKISLSKEQLDGVNLDGFLEAIDVEILLEVKQNVSCGIRNMDASKILVNLIDGGQSGYTLLHVTKNGYAGATGEGLKTGTSKADVLAKYGAPSHIQEAKGGQYLVYDFKQIAFQVKDGKVANWAIYRVSE